MQFEETVKKVKIGKCNIQIWYCYNQKMEYMYHIIA